jgi:hypothetical protein
MLLLLLVLLLWLLVLLLGLLWLLPSRLLGLLLLCCSWQRARWRLGLVCCAVAGPF